MEVHLIKVQIFSSYNGLYLLSCTGFSEEKDSFFLFPLVLLKQNQFHLMGNI